MLGEGVAPACQNLSLSSWKARWPHLQDPSGSLLKQRLHPDLDIIKDIILVVNTNWGGFRVLPNVWLWHPRGGRPPGAMSELCDFALQESFLQKWFLGRKSTPPVSEILEAVLLHAHLAPRLFGSSFDFCEPSQYPSDKVPFSFNLVSMACNPKNLNYYRSHPQIILTSTYWIPGIHQVLKYIIANSKNNHMSQGCPNKKIEFWVICSKT